MRCVKSQGSKIENTIISDLWKKGFRFRRNAKSLFGKPDISIKKYKTVIFIDSCFWHGCTLHCRIPKQNNEYWKNKIKNNKQHDDDVVEYYESRKWRLLRIWEHDLNDNYDDVFEMTTTFLSESKE